MLAFKYRFHGHGSLRYVYKNGSAERSRLFTVKSTRNKRRSTSRFSVVVSKKVHKSAVGRNRMRRRIYEIIRHEQQNIKEAYDVVVIISSSEVIAIDYHDIKMQIKHLFKEAGLYDTQG